MVDTVRVGEYQPAICPALKMSWKCCDWPASTTYTIWSAFTSCSRYLRAARSDVSYVNPPSLLMTVSGGAFSTVVCRIERPSSTRSMGSSSRTIASILS